MVLTFTSPHASLKAFSCRCIGACNVDVQPAKTTPGVILMGGGTDTDEAFVWQSKNANGGDFLVLRTSGTDAYNSYIQDLAKDAGTPLNSVTTILFNKKDAASDPTVLKAISNAEAIFFAGGDQSTYLDFWSGTQVQSIIQSKVANITIGGTSAGCAILGNWVYTGLVISIPPSLEWLAQLISCRQ